MDQGRKPQTTIDELLVSLIEAVNSTRQRDETCQKARFVVLEEFLVPEELANLVHYTTGHEADFDTSRVIAHENDNGVIDYNHRRSHVLFHTGRHQDVITDRILSFLPWVLDKLQHPLFSVSRVEVQLTASNDGEYFKVHNDNTHQALVTREITFVYFFHREPKAFTGGELRIYDSRWENGRYVAANNFETIVPEQNQVIFFPSFLMHEVAPVNCPTRSFIDGRFTLNGWIHRSK
jgi:SM-20-related protein